MKSLANSLIAAVVLSMAACATETQTTTTTTRTTERTSAADTTALDRSRNTNMQPSSDNMMGPR